jgi:hypothetical protein
MGESTPPGAAHPTGSPLVGPERAVDAPRYVAALRRGFWLMVFIVVPLTATVLVLSLLLPKSYTATASLVLDERQSVLDTSSGETSVRRLATTQRLLTSRDVLERAASQLPGETADTLEDKVKVTSDDAADIIRVQASDSDAAGAAAGGRRAHRCRGAPRTRGPAAPARGERRVGGRGAGRTGPSRRAERQPHRRR